MFKNTIKQGFRSRGITTLMRRSVLDDFSYALSVFDDPDIRAVEESLQLSQDALTMDENQLASQLVARLYQVKPKNGMELKPVSLSKTLENLLAQAHSSRTCGSFIPTRAFLCPPGGQHRKTLAGHAAPIKGLALTGDGKFLVTGSINGKLKVWDIAEGSVVTNVDDIGEELGRCMLCCNDELIAVSHKNMISLITLETGEILHKILCPFFDMDPPFGVSSSKEDDDSLVVFGTEQLRFYKIPPGRIADWELSTINPIGEKGNETLLSVCGHTIACLDHEDTKAAKILNTEDPENVKRIAILTQEDVAEFLLISALRLIKDADNGEMRLVAAKTARIDIYCVKSGIILQSLKGKVDDWIRNLEVTRDYTKLIFCKNMGVVGWDLKSSIRSQNFTHFNYVTKVVSNDGVVYITTASDDVARVWDLSYEDVYVHGPDEEIARTFLEIPGNPSQFMSVNVIGYNKYTATIWDSETSLPVRKVNNLPSGIVKMVDSETAIIRDEQKLKLLDLKSFEAIRTFAGNLSVIQYANLDDTYIVNHGKEVLTYTEHRSHLKIYDISTGKVLSVLKSGRENCKLMALLTNGPGTVAVCNDDLYDAMMVWNIEERVLKFKLTTSKYGSNSRLLLTYAAVTDNGSILALALRKFANPDIGHCPLIWDLTTGEFMHELNYPHQTDATELAILDDLRLVTGHKDNFINIWNMRKGALIQSLRDNINPGLTKLLIGPDKKTICTCTSKVTTLWDVSRGKKMATFTIDKVGAVHLAGPTTVALGLQSIIPVVILDLNKQKISSDPQKSQLRYVGPGSNPVPIDCLIEKEEEESQEEELVDGDGQ